MPSKNNTSDSGNTIYSSENNFKQNNSTNLLDGAPNTNGKCVT